MIAARGDGSADEEDQAALPAPSPPPILPQGGRSLLASIRAISGIDNGKVEGQGAAAEWPRPTVTDTVTSAPAKGLNLLRALTDQGTPLVHGCALPAGELGDAALQRGAVHIQGHITLLHHSATDKSRATKDHNAVEPKDKVAEQQGTIKGDISGDDQDKVLQQCTTHHLRATRDDQQVVEQGVINQRDQTTDGLAVDDQDKAVEQLTTYELGAVENNDYVDDQDVVEQGVIDKGSATMDEVVEESAIDRMRTTTDDIAVEDQVKVVEQCAVYESRATKDVYTVEEKEKVVEHGVIDRMRTTMDEIAVEDQEKAVEQCTVDESRATKDEYTVEEKEKVVDHGVIDRMRTTMDEIAVEDQEKAVEQGTVDKSRATKDEYTVQEKEKVVGQGVIDRMHTTMDEIAVEDQEKVVEQCSVDESRATKDEYTVEEKEKVVEHGVIDKQGAMPMVVTVKNHEKEMEQGIMDNQGAMPMDDTVKDREKTVGPYASDAIIPSKDENPVEEHKKVGDQGVIDENGRTKDDIGVEEHGYVKEQGIIDEWGRSSDGTVLEYQKNEAALCISDERIAIKDVVSVHIQGNMLEQRISDKQGATKSEFTVENLKEVVERVRHEWDATENDLAMGTTASEGISGISSSEVVSVTVNGSDGGIVKKEKVKLSVSVRYPQRPGKVNCPFYMSKGTCSYGFSCHFNHPPLEAKSDVSWFPSEQGNHGVAEILELNRVGLPIREGARSCTYYMRNGACRYGKRCQFNHPELVIDAQFYPPTGWEDNALPSSPHLKKSSDHTTLHGTSYMKKSSDHTTLDATSYLKRSTDDATLDDKSYSKKSSDHATLDDTTSSSKVLPPNILRMLLPPQKVPPSTGGKVVKVKKNSNWSSSSDDSDGCCSADSSDGPLCKQEHVDYPEKPGRPECPFYTRFGDCKFASACKYHHSKDRHPPRYHKKVSSLGEELIKYPERPGEPECPFYMKNSWCKFEAQCNFHHPKDLTLTTRNLTNAKKSVAAKEHHQATRIALKDYVPQQQQYPERPGQPDCRYYMQFGKCKYLSACIFHHPKHRLPSGWHPSDPAHSDQYDTWPPTNPSGLGNSCQQVQIGTEIHGMPECPFYVKTGKCQFGSACEFRHLKDVCSTTEEAFGHGTDLAYDNFTRSENVVQKQEHAVYPERPGEPECSHYMRHGSCKFQMKCKYHHPSDRLSKKSDSTYH